MRAGVPWESGCTMGERVYHGGYSRVYHGGYGRVYHGRVASLPTIPPWVHLPPPTILLHVTATPSAHGGVSAGLSRALGSEREKGLGERHS